MATAEIEVPHVYTAIAAILSALKVEKNGTLPGNLGGKPYITAVDAAQEVKRRFVENDLIFLPNENIFKHESIILKDRINVLISITGEYTIVSTRDGSQVTVSGTGDGLAAGTAVASNIASTNALKNALLRTFLITEQSVEDEAKNGAPEAPAANAASRAVNKARQPSTPARPTNNLGAGDLNVLKDQIREYIGNDDAKREDVNSRMAVLKSGGESGASLYKKLISDLGIEE